MKNSLRAPCASLVAILVVLLAPTMGCVAGEQSTPAVRAGNPIFPGWYADPDGAVFKEVTPQGYVEGPFMLLRHGRCYLMWSEGGWTGPNYSVAYAIADSPLGPFKRIGKILQQDPTVATGAGHHSVIQLPGKDLRYIVYHRRPLGERDGDHRVTCIDRMEFDEQGFIKPVRITFEGVERVRL